jgi:FtsH-binding integral membrane protein
MVHRYSETKPISHTRPVTLKEAATINCDEKEVPTITEPIFIYMAVSLGVLSFAAGIVILLLPLGILQSIGKFLGRPERSLWLLFTLGFAFGLALLSLGTTIKLKWKYSRTGGILLLVLGLASGVLLFLINAYWPAATGKTSLWWLFVTCTIFGGMSVYLPLRGKRLELKAEEEKRKVEEESRRRGPKIVLVKLRCI